MSRLIILLISFLFVTIEPVQSQTPELINNPAFRPDAKAAVDSIYNFRFEAADELMKSWQNRYPEHPVWTLFEGMKLWWEVLSDLQNTSRDEEFYHIMKKAEHEAGRLLSKDAEHADALLIRAISNGYLARQHSNREEWVTSLRYGRRAMKAHEYLMQVQPELEDLKLAEGLKLYYSAYLPEAYPAVRAASWFLPEGDKAKGLKLIKEASEEAIFAGAEATYFLGNITYNYEDDKAEAFHQFSKLHRKYPRNNYYARLLARNYYRRQQYDEALQFIDSVLADWDTKDLPYNGIMREELLTWKGRILEREGREGDALRSYRQAFSASEELPRAGERSFYAASGYGAGKLLYDRQKYGEAKEVLAKVRRAGNGSVYAKRASNLLSEIPD